jgi:predicted SnoaL-like aldol condensation-catalyzing enzyme
MGIDIFRIADGKIAEGWGVSDFHGLIQQLGDPAARQEAPGA